MLVVAHVAEERAFVTLLKQARPWWLLWALGLQAMTYVAQAEVWRIVLHSAGAQLPFGIAYRLSLAKLFVDQALPSVGLSGTVVVTQALEAAWPARDPWSCQPWPWTPPRTSRAMY